MLSSLEQIIPGISFTLLLLLMLSYWSQAAFFGEEKYRTLNNFIFFFAVGSLALLLILRWIISKHFPLSNLYESLIFLALSFLSVKAVFSFFVTPFTVTLVSSTPFGLQSSPRTGLALYKKGLQIDPVPPLGVSTGLDDACTLRYDPLVSPHLTRAFATQKHVKVKGTEAKLRDRSATYTKGIKPSKGDYKKLSLGLGVILSPLALLTFGFAFLSLPKEMQQSTALVPALQSNWLMMHVTVMVLSYAALISGSILSIAFLIISRFEKSSTNQKFVNKSDQKTNQRFVMLSSNNLENSILTARLDNYSYRILALGFPLLTIGILSGAVWANEAWGSYWSWDPKETWALITWLVFAIYLHTRITKGWSGQKPALVASVGFFMVWFCYLGVNLLGTGLHSYGWFNN